MPAVHQVSLTLMGDGPAVPWTLLEIEILVEDKETGEGKSLVHPLQVRRARVRWRGGLRLQRGGSV